MYNHVLTSTKWYPSQAKRQKHWDRDLQMLPAGTVVTCPYCSCIAQQIQLQKNSRLSLFFISKTYQVSATQRRRSVKGQKVFQGLQSELLDPPLWPFAVRKKRNWSSLSPSHNELSFSKVINLSHILLRNFNLNGLNVFPTPTTLKMERCLNEAQGVTIQYANSLK